MLKNYRNKNVKPMRPYVPGEDLTGISVSAEDIPEEGGMIAINPGNESDKWYVSKNFFEENYVEETSQSIDIKSYVICSTGEEIAQAEPDNDLEAAIKLMHEKNVADDFEVWSIWALINV